MSRSHEHACRGRRSITYRVWDGVVQRTTNFNHPSFSQYGGAGISVDPRWLGPGGFMRFLADVGQRPGKSYTLDRINRRKGYEKNNVRWATKAVQNTNRNMPWKIVVAHPITGESGDIRYWAARIGITPCALRRRLEKRSVLEALAEVHQKEFCYG